jgi:TonB C terminal
VSQTSVFKPSEVGLAVMLAVLLEAAVMVGLAIAGGSGSLGPEKVDPKELIPIQVTPVIDDVPLLKLGSKTRAKLPDMWRKPPPKPRYEDKSAPSTAAEKELKELPKNEVAKSNETPAPPSADLAKEVEEAPIPSAEPPEETVQPEEGENDGVKEGTEIDPLKGFVVSQYRIKLISWFKSGFSVPSGTECGSLTKVAARVGPDGTVTSFTISSPSGNEALDARVKAHMDGKVGQQVPPPPPNYPNILDAVVLPSFGKPPPCKDSKPSAPNPAPAPDEPSPSPPTDPSEE